MSVTYPPFARPGERAQRTHEELPPISRFIDELPSISEFLDELQPIEDFLADEVEESPASTESVASADHYPGYDTSEVYAPEPVDGGWVMDDWKSYDWTRLASLGRQSAEAMAADNDWNATEWTAESAETAQHEAYDANHEPSPHEVATALDEIARRIRAGELTIEQFHGSPPEAAMAAALASLLRMRG
jgi:hypothetical protein